MKKPLLIVEVLRNRREAEVNCSRTLYGCGLVCHRPRRLKPAATGKWVFNVAIVVVFLLTALTAGAPGQEHEREQEGPNLELEDMPTASLAIRVIAEETKEPVAEAKVQVFGGQVAMTDPDGIALMDNLPTGRCRVVVSKEEFAAAYQYVNLEPGREASLEVALGPEGKIIGVVTNEYGEILRDATCSIYTKEGRLEREQLDENGLFTVGGLSLSEDYTLQVYHPEYCTKTLADVTIPKETRLLTIEIALDVGGHVKGRVTDSKGRPVEGARLTASTSGANPTAETDAQGEYLLERLPLEKTWVRVTAPRCAPDRRQVTPDRRGATVNFSLPPGRELAGRIVDEEGKPLDQVAVRPYVSSFGYVAEMVTGEDGRFAFDSLPDEAVTLYCRAQGYSDPRPTVKPGPKDMTVTLYRAGHILGKVVDEAGKPVTEFRVSLGLDSAREGDRRPSYPSRFPYRTGMPIFAPDGAFRIEDATVGAPYRITIYARDYATTTESRIMGIPLDKGDVATITVEKGRTFAGKVVDAASGAPVAGAEIILSMQKPEGSSRSYYRLSRSSDGLPTGTLTCSSREDGGFQLDNISPRGYYVAVVHPDYVELELGYIRFSPSSSESKPKNGGYADIPPAGAQGILGAVFRLSKGAAVSGRCCGEDGKPLAGARVLLSGVKYVTTGEDGAYRFDKVLPGRYTLTFYEMASKSSKAYRSVYVTVQADEELTMDFRPYEGIALNGEVVGDKKLRKSLRIQVEDAGERKCLITTATDSKGRFTVTGLKPGRYRVNALQYDNRRYQTVARETVTVTEEGPTSVTLRIK
ncbi:MAG: carboxypeptidase-like regulatory domain-containing protein [Planctomycetota bacterium]